MIRAGTGLGSWETPGTAPGRPLKSADRAVAVRDRPRGRRAAGRPGRLIVRRPTFASVAGAPWKSVDGEGRW
jgi:hypothetical protein